MIFWNLCTVAATHINLAFYSWTVNTQNVWTLQWLLYEVQPSFIIILRQFIYAQNAKSATLRAFRNGQKEKARSCLVKNINDQKNKTLSSWWTFDTYHTHKLSLIYWVVVLCEADLNIVILSFLPDSSQKKYRFMSSLVEDLAADPREACLVLIGLGCAGVSSSESSSLTSACFLLWALVSFALLHLLKHDLCHDAWWDISVSSIPLPSSKRDKGTWIGRWPSSSNFGRLLAKLL